MTDTDLLVVGTVAPTVGGIASAVTEQVAALRSRGWTIEVLNTGQQRRRNPSALNLENTAAAIGHARAVSRACHRLRPSVVAVHTVGTPSLPLVRSLALVAAARMHRIPVAVHIHGYAAPSFGTGWRLLSRLASAVVVLHQGMADQLVALAPGLRIEVVPNCVDCQELVPVPRARSSQEVRIVFVGTVGQRKGVPTLLRALGRVHGDFTCDIVGGPAEEGEDAHWAVRAESEELVRSGRVTFHGELTPAEARRRMADADIFVLPSTAEGMPMALLEAMSLALPVVVTDAGAMADVVRGARCGEVVPVDDELSLAQALEDLARHPARRVELGMAARRAIERGFCCGDTMSRLGAIYDGIRRG